MSGGDYAQSVDEYLQAQGWRTSATRVREDTALILAETDTERMMAMAVTDRNSVGEDHLGYLLKAARKKDADRALVTAAGGLPADIRRTATEHGIETVNTETVAGGNYQTGSGGAEGNSPTAQAGSSAGASGESEPRDSGQSPQETDQSRPDGVQSQPGRASRQQTDHVRGNAEERREARQDRGGGRSAGGRQGSGRGPRQGTGQHDEDHSTDGPGGQSTTGGNVTRAGSAQGPGRQPVRDRGDGRTQAPPQDRTGSGLLGTLAGKLGGHKRLLAVLFVLVLAGGAAAIHFGLPGGGGVVVEDIPQRADVVVAVDGATLESTAAKAFVGGALGAGNAPAGFATLSGGLSEIERRTGLDVQGASRITVFGATEAESAYFAVRLTGAADRPLSRVVDGAAAGDFTRDSYRGVTVYRTASLDGVTGPVWYAKVSKGTYLLGTPAAVKDGIDVATGSGDEWSGSFRRRVKSKEGGLKFGYRLPPGEGGRLRVVAGGVEANGNRITFDVSGYAADPATASRIATRARTGLDRLESRLRRSGRFGSVADDVAGISVSRDGTEVTVSGSGDADAFGRLVGGVLINTAGFLQSTSEATGQQASRQTTDRLVVTAATGEVAADGNAVSVVNVTVARRAGAADIDLRDVTVQWVGPSGTYQLTHENVDGGNGKFGVTAFKDDDGSAPVLNAADDRFVLTFDLAGATSADNSNGNDHSFAERLPAGSEVQLTLTTRSGASVTRVLVVPQSLSGKEAVSL